MSISDLFIIPAMFVVAGLLGWLIAWVESWPQ